MLQIACMKQNQQFFLAILLVLFFNTAVAQPQFSGWLASVNTIKTGKKTSLHTDIQLRSTDKLEYTQTLILRSGINFHINKKNIITAGYGLVHGRRNVSGITGYLNEHRLWQQYLHNHKWKQISLTHRFRLEQRFLPVAAVINNRFQKTKTVTNYRLRYFYRSTLPLKKQAVFSKGFFAALQNEVFVNIANKNNVNGKFFDQNRFYIAAGYRLSSKADIETGYMNQYVNGSGQQFVNNHIIQVAGYLRL